MPGMDGLAFRREQLRDADLAAIPVAVCTARDDLLDAPEFRAGAAFLPKPVDPLRLLDFVRRYGAVPG
jgi:CheY-like chemotaxis protein